MKAKRNYIRSLVEAKEKLMSEEGLMSLVEHLTELRKRVIYIAIVLVFALVLGLVFAEPTYRFILEQKPAAGTLELHTFSFWDGIGIYMQIAFIVALVITLPFIVLQLWLFVKPALLPHEQKSSLKYVPFVIVMALLGLSFAYFVVFPLAFNFTRSVSESLGLEETYGVKQYFDFMFSILLPITILFELPLVIMFLTAIRIVNPIRLRKMRKVAYFLMAVIGVMITPPDFISDILVIIPLIVLYEISVWLSGTVYKKQLANDEKWKQDEDLAVK